MVVIVASSCAFLLLKTVNGDQFTASAQNPDVSPEYVARLRAKFGNDQPLVVQYWHWVSGLLQGDLLESSSHRGQPVVSVIAAALPRTLLLTGLALCSSIAFGVALGAWQGAHVGSRTERVSSTLSLGVISLPDFWIAMLLLIVFVLKLGWFAAQGTASATGSDSLLAAMLDRLGHLFLPWLALTLVGTAVIARYQRAAMRDVMLQQYLQTARAKGVPETLVTRRHALRVAIVPVITIVGLFFPALLVGAILVEKVFGWPGMGDLLTRAIDARDYFLVAGIVVVGSAITALGSLLADMLREWADPRLRV